MHLFKWLDGTTKTQMNKIKAHEEYLISAHEDGWIQITDPRQGNEWIFMLSQSCSSLGST